MENELVGMDHLPTDWGVVTLSSICAPKGLVRGPFGGSITKEMFTRKGYKVYEQRNAIYRDTEIGTYYVGKSKFSQLKRFSVAPGDFIVSCSGTIGRIFRLPPHSPPGIINQALLKIRTDDELIEPGYFFHYFESPEFQGRIIENTHGGAMQNLVGMSEFRQIEIAYPPLPEQRAIAEALSDVDGLIAALEALIAKKRAIKLATMQQLLTGRTRLPGFSAESSKLQISISVVPSDWKLMPIGELFSFKNGLNKGKEYFGFGTPIVNFMDVFNQSGLHSGELHGRVTVSRAELKNFEVQQGDVFFTRTSETVDEIGVAAVMLDAPRETVFSGFLLRARPKDERLDDQFKKYCFASESVRKQIVTTSTYTTRALTNGRLLSNVWLPIPSIEEQRAIAQVLSDMDAEIEALEARVAKTRDIKQGMMQQLLTGRIRLVPPHPEEGPG